MSSLDLIRLNIPEIDLNDPIRAINPEVSVITPFSPSFLKGMQVHAREVRRLFDYPGSGYLDERGINQNMLDKDGQPVKDVYKGKIFNRWYIHKPPVFDAIHKSKEMTDLASKTFGLRLKPSYSFLSMYGPSGVCPLHMDRPQCQYTIDIQLNSDGQWPIYVSDNEFVLKNGEALCYSGTGQPHYRKPMAVNGECTYMDLVFFHFVPYEWEGCLE